MIQVVYRRSAPLGRRLYHVGVGGENPEGRTVCGRWLRGATIVEMEPADYRSLGDRRCAHCVRREIG